MSEGTETVDLSALQRTVDDHEMQLEKMEASLNGMAALVHQMDGFLREMIRLGVFEQAVQALEKKQPTSKLIM